jgi:hypothetical protein
MFAKPAATWHPRNQYNAQAAWEHREGIVRHERWSITCDPIVQYAYAVVLDPEKLTLRDRLILPALGVSRTTNQCQGKGKTS